MYGFSEVDLTSSGGDKVLNETLYKFGSSSICLLTVGFQPIHFYYYTLDRDLSVTLRT